MGRSSASKDSLTPRLLAHVTEQPQYSRDRRHHESKERVRSGRNYFWTEAGISNLSQTTKHSSTGAGNAPSSLLPMQVYGKTSRRKKIANLRGIAINGGSRKCKFIPEHKEITLHDELANQAAKLQLYEPDSSRSSKPRIPSESHIMSMLRLDVEAVRGLSRYREKTISSKQLCFKTNSK